jgi:type IV secretion system protein VirB4
LETTAIMGFDVTDFLDNPVTGGPVTMYLFQIVKRLLDGRRLVVWMDEFSKLLSDPSFEGFAKDGLKTWRKLEGVAAFATQSPSDVLASPSLARWSSRPRPRSSSRTTRRRKRTTCAALA